MINATHLRVFNDTGRPWTDELTLGRYSITLPITPFPWPTDRLLFETDTCRLDAEVITTSGWQYRETMNQFDRMDHPGFVIALRSNQSFVYLNNSYLVLSEVNWPQTFVTYQNISVRFQFQSYLWGQAARQFEQAMDQRLAEFEARERALVELTNEGFALGWGGLDAFDFSAGLPPRPRELQKLDWRKAGF